MVYSKRRKTYDDFVMEGRQSIERSFTKKEGRKAGARQFFAETFPGTKLPEKFMSFEEQEKTQKRRKLKKRVQKLGNQLTQRRGSNIGPKGFSTRALFK